MNNWGIRTKVMVLALVPTAATALLLAAYLTMTALNDIERSLIDRGHAIARQLGPAMEYGVSSGNTAVLQPLAEAALRETDMRSVVITDANGNVLVRAGADPERVDNTSSDIAPTTALTAKGGSQLFRAPIFQSRLDVDSYLDRGAFPSQQAQEASKLLGWVNVEISRQATQARRARILSHATLITGLLLFLSGLLAHRMSRGIVRPVLKLTEAVGAIAEGHLDTQVHVGAGAELAQLARGVNTMAKALKTSQEGLEERINDATDQLLTSLAILEQKNTALDQARRDAEAANEVKSDFVARMSHEIRTPLNGMLGFLSLLSRTNLDRAQHDFVGKIELSTKSLLSVINDILDFSKLEAGKMAIERIDFDLRETIDDAVSGFAPLAHGKGIALITIVDPDIPDALVGGAGRIVQVINNLLSNAIKFTGQGKVVLRTGKVSESDNAVTIRCAVYDTGPGIAAEDLTSLFQPFVQLDRGVNRVYSGTGLGLVIARTLIETMGGEISVQSQLGHGSCFSFQLSLHKQLFGNAARPQPPRALRALVMSPCEDMRASLESQLAISGAITTAVLDRESAVDSLLAANNQDQLYDVIFVDNALPDAMQIPEAFRGQLGASLEGMVLLENSYPSTNPDRLRQAGFAASLQKPVRHRDIAALLQQLPGGEISLSLPATSETSNARPLLLSVPRLSALVVDDNEINREYLTVVLREIGADVDEATDGADAVAQCERNRYDIILMDIHMPRVDGYEATIRIREILRKHNRITPIIAITADVTPNQDRFQHAGFSDFLVKPVMRESLVSTVQKWFATVTPTPTGNDDCSVREYGETDLVVDRDAGVRLASGDHARWQKALRTMVSRLPQDLDTLRQAIAGSRLAEAREQAHKIKGSAAYCATPALQEAARQLETAAALEDPGKVEAAFSLLEYEVDRIDALFQNEQA